MINDIMEYKNTSTTTSEGLREESKQSNPVVMYGWRCPVCGRVYSPYTSMCSYCGIEHLSLKPVM